MGYPAVTLGEDCVHGYLLTFADIAVLDALDQLEDYQPGREMSANLYYRQQVEVHNLQGLSLGCAWIYLMSLEKVRNFGGIFLPDGWWSNSGLTP
jgi:gamma-glutamylcyclotransferase (GGCT)/AIG2-like uncharacterized protein YtfP